MAVSQRELQTSVPANLSIIDNVNLQAVQHTMQKIAQFQAVVKNTLKEGHDYGIIKGTERPTLLKPGAEKILMLMGLTSEYEIVSKVEDYETGFFAYTVRCLIYRQEQKITEGLGHANTRERRYTSGRQQDAYTLANTVLKMAKKRAQVDAALTVASLSEIFTQDVEDFGPEEYQRPSASPQQQYQQKQAPTGSAMSTPNQQKAIHAIASAKNINLPEILKGKYSVEGTKDLTKQQASELIDWLQNEPVHGTSEREPGEE